MLTRIRAPEEVPQDVGTELGSVRLRDVRKMFGAARRRAGAVVAVDRLSLDARPGEIVAVVGPSGCGKTTLLELVCGLIEPDAGTVDAAPAALMAQRDLLLPWLAAVDNAALALRVAGLGRQAARERSAALLRDFGLEGFEDARPHELSGGMRQRVAFARTLLSGRTVLCLDEPFASLDALTRQEMQDWLALALAPAPRTVVLVTHDVEEAIVLADRVLVLSPRPAYVVAELEVDVARPRKRTDARLVALRERALQELGA
ncbi:MAG TPA: ATP-binding cassette domain-containing protein [Solirubrobacteraceae bacterium]|nr:ATP-binding cassette domain-containing protein [Solirubrobacteraceae bacterium]